MVLVYISHDSSIHIIYVEELDYVSCVYFLWSIRDHYLDLCSCHSLELEYLSADIVERDLRSSWICFHDCKSCLELGCHSCSFCLILFTTLDFYIWVFKGKEVISGKLQEPCSIYRRGYADNLLICLREKLFV